MNCTEAQQLVYLSVGGDLPAPQESALNAHLHNCKSCQAEYRGAGAAMEALSSLRSVESGSANSVWPGVLRGIRQSVRRNQVTRRFNLQVAALSVCSLVIAMVVIVQTLTTMREEARISSTVQLPAFYRMQSRVSVPEELVMTGQQEIVPVASPVSNRSWQQWQPTSF